jgi:fermentation-respiration switch protein FrsA (DUF1100 family)
VVRPTRVILELLLVALVCMTASCAHPLASPSPPHQFERQIDVNQHALTLHLTPGHANPLIVYATGDGGWRGKDRELYEQLQGWGYASAGFSSPDYLRNLPGDDGTTTPARLAADFSTIVDAARNSLQMPLSPVVLVGVSRGADLAVVAAGQPRLQPQLSGVVAMALTREEEYVQHRREPTVPFDVYGSLPQLGDIPISVIQSTRDNYLPAGDARALFGADSPRRVLHAIDARNHSFGGARPALYSALRTSLAWIERIGRRGAAH